MADIAAKIAKANGLASASGGPISIIAGRLEDVDSLPHGKARLCI